VGRTVTQFQVMANGGAALQYTGNGLYAQLNSIKDQFGNPVQFNQNNFRKFDAVNQMYTAYDTQLNTYNMTLANLNIQLTTALNNLNSAGTQMETEKYSAQVNAISAQINSLGHQTQQVGQRVLVQNAMNANSSAAYQEAQNEASAQGRQAALQRLTTTMSSFIGGGQ
jgi:predicted  nucleic acid-binding Zn-ribbon protein